MDRTQWLLGGRYRMDERVGAGGMGEVWRATDQVLGRAVAVKLMLPALLQEPGFERRFLFEARAMASLQHPGVVAIHDYRSDGEGAYLVMEYVEGEALSWTLRRLGRLTPVETMNLVAQVADALSAAHAQGIVHRDVKPANLLLRPDGTLVLTDFGIARAASAATLTTTGEVLGTPSYLAPEQVLGKPATPLSDIYALGVVAYECLAGRRPFVAENPFGVAMKRLQDMPAPLGPEVPEEVARVVGGALARDPGQRWQSAADLAAAARAAARAATASWGSPTTRTPTTRTSATVDSRLAQPIVRAVEGPTRRPVDAAARRRRRRTAVIAVVATALALFAGVIWATTHGALDRGGRPTATGLAGAPLPAPIAGKYVRCGDVYCPTTSMCWGGLNSSGGRAAPPSAVECDEIHRWETFAVTEFPLDAVEIRQDELFEKRPDIASICTKARADERRLAPSSAAEVRIDAWPVQLDATTWVLYCLGGGPETTGRLFRTGA